MKLYKIGDYYHYESDAYTQDIHPSRLDIFDMRDGRVRISIDSLGRSVRLDVQEHFLFAEVLDKDGNPHGTTFQELMASLNTGMDVNPQDQITPPLDSLFVEQISNFTLSVDAVASGVAVLVYTFTATTGHGLVIGNELILLDVAADRSLQAIVINVATNVITIDRPIDHAFAATTTLGRVTNSNMNVVGSLAAPRIFTLRAGSGPHDYTRFLLTMLDDSSMDDSKFGALPALTNGMVFRMYNTPGSGFQKTIWNFKTNSDIKQWCYDVGYSPKSAAGFHGLSARMTFNGPSKHGVPLRIKNLGVIQFIVQDDLTGALRIIASGEGQQTEGEK